MFWGSFFSQKYSFLFLQITSGIEVCLFPTLPAEKSTLLIPGSLFLKFCKFGYMSVSVSVGSKVDLSQYLALFPSKRLEESRDVCLCFRLSKDEFLQHMSWELSGQHFSISEFRSSFLSPMIQQSFSKFRPGSAMLVSASAVRRPAPRSAQNYSFGNTESLLQRFWQRQNVSALSALCAFFQTTWNFFSSKLLSRKSMPDSASFCFGPSSSLCPKSSNIRLSTP